jgi:hypothetical protein
MLLHSHYMPPWHTVFGDKENFTNRHIKFKYTVWILNCYSQSNTGRECGFSTVRLNLTDMKGLTSQTMPCHQQLCTFTTCHRQCFQHIPTHAPRCLPTHQHTLQKKMGSDNMHSYRWLSMSQGNLMLPTVFCSENGGNKFPQKTGNHLPNYMASYPRRPKS